MADLELPGAEIVDKGVADLARGEETVESLLVSMAVTRLRELGVAVPSGTFPDAEARLYARLDAGLGDGAHSRYNALRRRLVSYLRTAGCVNPVDAGRIRRFLEELGRSLREPTEIFLTGGASAVLEGWRATTADVDLKIVPDREIFAVLPRIKEDLRIKVELATPSDFIPELPRWRERCRPVGRFGSAEVHHVDFCSQALAKVERGFEKDLADVREMIRRGLVDPAEALRLFRAIEPELRRYPALDPRRFRASVEAMFGGAQPSG